jgi:hypothetical protein
MDFAGSRLTVGRALSAGVETSTKSRRIRQVPTPDQAAAGAAQDVLQPYPWNFGEPDRN